MFFRFFVRDDLALVDDEDPVADGFDLGEDVRAENDGAFCFPAPESGSGYR